MVELEEIRQGLEVRMQEIAGGTVEVPQKDVGTEVAVVAQEEKKKTKESRLQNLFVGDLRGKHDAQEAETIG